MKMKKALVLLLSSAVIMSSFAIPAVASVQTASVTFTLDDDEVVSAYTAKLVGEYGKSSVQNYTSSGKSLKYQLQNSDGSKWTIMSSGTVTAGSTTTTVYYQGSADTDTWRVYVGPSASLTQKTIKGKATLYVK